MLSDLRFVFGAALAIAMLAVAGLGLAISTQLLREAVVRPLESPQALAYAGQAEDNPFYDPGSALRFTKALGRPEAPAVEVRLARPAEPNPAPPATPDEPVSIPADRIEANAAGEKAVDPSPARAAETAPSEPLASAEEAKPAAPEAAVGTVPPPQPAEPERVAVAPATSPEADDRKEGNPAATPQIAGGPAEGLPAPAAQPVHHKPRKVARPVRPSPTEQSYQYSGFPSGNTQWPNYGNTWGTGPATNTKKSSGASSR
jgi:hypothetical protein